MKQVININFQGSIIPIEVPAYDTLKNYIASLTNYFAAEEGKDEIINDIESRIAELFQIRLKSGATCIEDADVQAIMNSIGRPEDLATEEEKINNQQNTKQENKKENSLNFGGGKRRFFRDENNKLVGGVCSGVANYFDIDIAIVRIVFLILLFSFGIGFIPYIILWIALPSSAEQVIGSRRKKLYRDTDEKVIGGVASGIAHYFDINVWIPRLIFLLPLVTGIFDKFDDFNFRLGFEMSPAIFIIYIILWLVLPQAKSTTEKLEMKGEKVDLNSIKETVTDELKGVQLRAQKFGKELTTVATEKGNAFGKEIGAVGKKGGSAFGEILSVLIKGFVYLILGVVGISLVVFLFGGSIISIKYFALKDFLVRDGWQNILTWGVLIFFILSPIVGIITWIIRRVTKVKTGSNMLRLSFIAMWIIGWVCISLLGASLGKDFKYSSKLGEEQVYINNPKVQSLQIANTSSAFRFRDEDEINNNILDSWIDNDTMTLDNVEIHLFKSNNDSFRITSIKKANGFTTRNADSLASTINIKSNQLDTLLVLDNRLKISTKEKFRNQRVHVCVYVPIGKRIKVDGNYGRVNTMQFDGLSMRSGRDYNRLLNDNEETGWDKGEWYTMTAAGLVPDFVKKSNNDDDEFDEENGELKINKNGLEINDGKKKITIDENGINTERNIGTSNGSYRYDNKSSNKKDSMKLELEKAQKKYNDSIQKEKEKIDRQNEVALNTETAFMHNKVPTNLLMNVFKF